MTYVSTHFEISQVKMPRIEGSQQSLASAGTKHGGNLQFMATCRWESGGSNPLLDIWKSSVFSHLATLSFKDRWGTPPADGATNQIFSWTDYSRCLLSETENRKFLSFSILDLFKKWPHLFYFFTDSISERRRMTAVCQRVLSKMAFRFRMCQAMSAHV